MSRRVASLREPRDAVAGAVAAGVLLAAFWLASPGGAWSPKRGVGLWLGILAAALYVFGMAYPARRPRARPFATARIWLRLHLWLGALAFVAAVLHAGLRWPAGGQGRALVVLALLVTLTGLAGTWLQRVLPAALAEGGGNHALLDRIPLLQSELLGEAERAVEGCDEALEAVYAADVRPRLAMPLPRWAYLRDIRAGRGAALAALRELEPFVEGDEAKRVATLLRLTERKLELDAQMRLQRVLRGWLAFHGVPAGLLIGLLVIHVAGWVLY
jgi:hypothetical protein